MSGKVARRNRKNDRSFDRVGFAHAITNPYLRSHIADGFADVASNEKILVNLPINCPDPSLYATLFAKFGGDECVIEDEGETYTVSNGDVSLSGATSYASCLVWGLTPSDFLPV